MSACAYVRQLRKEIARLRKSLGPPCPKCGRWLLAEHDRVSIWISRREDGELCATTYEIIANHPRIAARLGLEV